MINMISTSVARGVVESATSLSSVVQDPLNWTQINVMVGAFTGLVVVLGLLLTVLWRGRKEFGDKIDKLDLSIDNLTASLNDLRVATVSRTELDSFGTRLLQVEMQCVRVDANIGAANERIGRLEENYGTQQL